MATRPACTTRPTTSTTRRSRSARRTGRGWSRPRCRGEGSFHARRCAGHPRLDGVSSRDKDVDGRDEPGHDERLVWFATEKPTLLRGLDAGLGRRGGLTDDGRGGAAQQQLGEPRGETRFGLPPKHEALEARGLHPGPNGRPDPQPALPPPHPPPTLSLPP